MANGNYIDVFFGGVYQKVKVVCLFVVILFINKIYIMISTSFLGQSLFFSRFGTRPKRTAAMARREVFG